MRGKRDIRNDLKFIGHFLELIGCGNLPDEELIAIAIEELALKLAREDKYEIADRIFFGRGNIYE